MRINKIEIRDFRCFKTFNCVFTPGVNVFIGHNGAGKTSLIHAIHKAVSFIFSNSRSLGTEFLSKGNSTLNIRSFKDGDYWFDPVTREQSPYASIKAEAEYNATLLSWELYRRNQPNAALYQRHYKNAFNIFMREWKGNNAPLPLLAYYSDSYPHKDVKTMQYALSIVNKDVMPRNFGYYQWDEEVSCTTIWELRMCNCISRVQPYYTQMSRLNSELLSMEQKDASELERDNEYLRLKKEVARINKITEEPMKEQSFVEKKLQTFAAELPGIKKKNREIDYLGAIQTLEGYRVALYFKDGSFSLMQELPAGYRRLYSIVFDMAYRSYILNGNVEPEGIVIIDEIDLHLHPELETEVVNVFHNVFPRVQFIMSTHSPAVITNLPSIINENQILRMEEGVESPTILSGTYGLDYNTGVEDFMGADARNAEIENLLNSLAFFELKGMKQQSSNVKRLLLKKLKGNEVHLKELLEKRMKEMGNEIHQ